MKKNLNVIQIKGIRGLILAGLIVCCLIAGFIAFPGWIGMNLWNLVSKYIYNIPEIGLIQGILLWAIILTSYFIFRKDKVIVCMKSPEGLNEEELKTVFAQMRKQTLEDPILQAMLKARDAELKYKAQQNIETKEPEATTTSENNNFQN